jgi:hypothetical protein
MNIGLLHGGGVGGEGLLLQTHITGASSLVSNLVVRRMYLRRV